MPEVYFVFLGGPLPKYALSSLLLAKVHSGLTVTLVAEGHVHRQIKNLQVGFVGLEDFYDPSRFQQARSQVKLDHDFRGGFWLHTLERFFVLEQLMRVRMMKSIFHAEMDQLLFSADRLVTSLSSQTRKGLFFPVHSKEKAVASVFFCNDISQISSLVESAAHGPPFANEMELLLRWARNNPTRFFALPTLRDVVQTNSKLEAHETLPADEIGGVTDAAELGLWVGGRDPRNLALSKVPSTKFVYHPEKAALSHDFLRTLNFEFEVEASRLFVSSKRSVNELQIYNLHIHSKIHSWLARERRNLINLLESANRVEPFKVPGTRLLQAQHALRVAFSQPGRSRRTIKFFRKKLGQLYIRLMRIRGLRLAQASAAISRGSLLLAQTISPRIHARAIAKSVHVTRSSYEFSPTERLSNSRVVLIGPAYFGSSVELIANYDIVCRLGYVGNHSGPQTVDDRCDISFLARWHADKLLSAASADRQQDAVRYFARSDVSSEVFSDLQKKVSIDRFSVENCNRLFGRVVPNFGPQVILWLLAHNPVELHISHLDLLTDPRRPAGYPTNKNVIMSGDSFEYEKSTIRRSFSQFHNPFTHYSFFSGIQGLPNVTFSDRLNEIIDGGIGGYRRIIKKLYFD